MAFESQVSVATMMSKCSWEQRPRRSSIFGSKLVTLADSMSDQKRGDYNGKLSIDKLSIEKFEVLTSQSRHC